MTNVIISKYIDHIPLYRQSNQYGRLGVPIARSVLHDWLASICGQFQTIEAALRERVLDADHLHVDEKHILVCPKKMIMRRRKKMESGKSAQGPFLGLSESG